MMKVSIEELSTTRRKLAVELPADDVEKEVERSFRELAKSVQLKGFRPGRAPRSLLVQLYGKEVDEEVSGKLIEETIPKVLEEHKLEPVAMPVIEEKELGEDRTFRYTALVEVEPAVELGNYRGIEIQGEKISVADSDVDQALEQLRMSRSKLVDREGADVVARRGDYVVADWDMEIEGKDGSQASRKDADLELAPGGMLPELIEGLEGARAGETRTIEAVLGDQSPDRDLVGKKATFKVTVHKVQERKLPELTDELAKEASGLESVEALRLDLRDKIQKRLEREAHAKQHDQLIDKLLERHDFEAPESLVEATVRSLTRFSGGDQPEPTSDEAREERRASIEAAAKRRVKADMLLRRIADKEDLTVTEGDLDASLAERAEAIGQDPAILKAAYQKKGLLDELRGDLRRQRALDFLRENATILGI